MERSIAGDSLPGTPSWEHQETLFSWCVRFNAQYGVSTRGTGKLLFDRTHSYLQHALPSGMSHFQLVTGGALGTSRQILRDRTVAGAYWPYLNEPERDRLVAKCQQSSDVAIGGSGFGASGWSAKHWLRFCAKCVRMDQDRFRTARWKLFHQLPGVQVCVEHSQPLQIYTLRTIAWPLPGGPTLKASDKSSDFLPVMAKLAIVATESFSIERVNTTSLATACLARLFQLGLFTGNSKTSELSLNSWFRDSELGRALSAQMDQALPPANWISRLLKYRAASHPLQWQLLWVALHEHEDPDESAELFSTAARGQELPYEKKQLSLWPVMSIPGALIPGRSALREALMLSPSLSVAAGRLSIEPVHLLRRLMQEPDLLVGWRRRLVMLRTRAAIERIHAAAAGNAVSLDSNAIQRACSAEFAWLRHRSPASLAKILRALDTSECVQPALL